MPPGHGELRAPFHVPTYLNWLFPTPIITSFTPPSFLTDSSRFHYARGGKPAPSVTVLNPLSPLWSIDHEDDGSLPIYVVREMWTNPPRRGWFLIWVTIVDKDSSLFIWPTAIQQYFHWAQCNPRLCQFDPVALYSEKLSHRTSQVATDPTSQPTPNTWTGSQ